MIIYTRKIYKGSCVDIENELGLFRGDILQVSRDENGTTFIVPDDRAEDIRDLIEPYQGKADYALSELKDLTWQQLSNHIDGISSLAEARTYLKKLSFVVMALVKHTHIDK